MIRESERIAQGKDAELSLGYLNSYSGEEFMRSVAAFSEKYPTVRLHVMTGNHEELLAKHGYYYHLYTAQMDEKGA